jgi:hypothetical protein
MYSLASGFPTCALSYSPLLTSTCRRLKGRVRRAFPEVAEEVCEQRRRVPVAAVRRAAGLEERSRRGVQGLMMVVVVVVVVVAMKMVMMMMMMMI